MVNLKERALRVLIEQDLYKVGESDTFILEERHEEYTVLRTETGWVWRLQRNTSTHPVVSTHSYPDACKLFRAMFTFLKMEW